MAKRKNRKPKRRPVKVPEARSGPKDGAAKVDPNSRTGRFQAAMDRMEKTADERPPAPWGSFPLGPLSVLAGLVLIIIGAIGSNPAQLAIGVGLGCLGGLELSIREHFAGFRSHTTLLAGFVFVIAVGVTYFGGRLVLWVCLAIGLALAAPAFWWFRRRFEQASGGLAYKIR